MSRVTGTQYLDELVCLWVQKGYHMFVAHDANYNAIGLTDKAGNEVEKYAYTPYGQVLADQTSGRGDFDGDGDADNGRQKTAAVPICIDSMGLGTKKG